MVALPLGQKIFRHTAGKGAATHDAGTGSGDAGRFPLLYSAKADSRGAIRVFSLSLMEAAQVRQRFRTGDEGECGLGRFGHQDRAAVETEPGSDVFRIQSGRQRQTVVSLSHSERARAASSGLCPAGSSSAAVSAGQGTKTCAWAGRDNAVRARRNTCCACPTGSAQDRREHC